MNYLWGNEEAQLLQRVATSFSPHARCQSPRLAGNLILISPHVADCLWGSPLPEMVGSAPGIDRRMHLFEVQSGGFLCAASLPNAYNSILYVLVTQPVFRGI